MRIKFNEDYNGDGVEYKKGQEYDVADTQRALTYVRSGLAKPADKPARDVVAEAAPPAAKAAAKK